MKRSDNGDQRIAIGGRTTFLALAVVAVVAVFLLLLIRYALM